jgi:hypothetical protein
MISVFGRNVLTSCVAAAMLAGCSGPQPSTSAPGSFDKVTQSRSVGLLYASALRLPQRASAKPQYKAASPLMFVVNFITNSGVGNVVVYDPATNDPNPIAVITSGINQPNGDCVDASGTLYVGNDPGSGPGWVSEYTTGKTKPFKTITDGLDGPALCTIDGQGNLWVTNNGGAANVTEYLKGSTKPHMTITKGLTYPIGIAIDPDGNLYVGNHVLYGTTNVQVYPPGSKSPTRTITDGVVWPTGVTVDAKDTLYVANDNPPCNVEEYRAGQNHPYRAITDEIDGPTGLSVGKNGWLYVSNEGTQGCSGPWPALLEFRPGSVKPSGKMISKDLQTPVGNAHFPPLLP